MKKIMLIGLLCLAVAPSLFAQTWSEWFRQKATQRKYLLQQIAGLEVYLGYAKQGYNIVGQGISTVNALKRGDFSIHDEFIASLSKVNPKLGEYAKIADVIALQVKILRQLGQTKGSLQQSNQLTSGEWAQYSKATDALVKDCAALVESLILLITDGQLRMSDADRLKRIERLHLDMQAKFGFSTAFTNEAKMLCLQRLAERGDIELSKRINGIK